ncbi:hypothetical protein Bca4012_004053 [Brassica carinata]
MDDDGFSNLQLFVDSPYESKGVCLGMNLIVIESLVIEDLLALFLDVQTIGDRNLRKLAFSHIVQCFRQKDETKTKRALVTLCELLKKKVWLGDRHDRVAIAICEACFHASPRIMVSSLRFLLDYENIEDEDDSDASDNDDDEDSKHESHVSD